MPRATASIATLAVAAVFAATASGTPTSVPNLSRLGTWTLADLGAPAGLTFDGSRRTWRPTWELPFALDSGERAGGSNWWVLHLHYRVTFVAHPPVGVSAIFGAMTNQVACAYTRFEVARTASGEMIRVRSESLISGYSEHRVQGTSTYEGHFSNFVATAGIKSGRNLLQLVVSQLKTPVVEKLTILPDSFVEHTTTGPSFIAVAATAPTTVRKSAVLVVSVRVRDRANAAAHQVEVGVQALGEHVRYLGPHLVRVGTLPAGQSRRYEFRLRASRRGLLTLAVDATGTANHAGRVLTVDVR